MCASGEDCSHRWGDEGLSVSFWEFVGLGLDEGITVNVGPSLTGAVNLAESFRMLAGETRGFAIVSDKGIRPGTRTGNNVFMDPFMQVRPGRILYGIARPPGVGLNHEHLSEGTITAPYLFAGTVRYVNEEVAGDEYR
jgi:hypothetical protein